MGNVKENIGRIYIIRNKVNNKVYIGQTIHTLHERFLQHTSASRVRLSPHRKLCNAIRKYGKEQFYIELLEDNISISHLNDRKIYYIEKFDSYNKGYNATTGGDGTSIYKDEDIERIKNLVEQRVPNTKIAKLFGVNVVTIQRILASLGIKRIKPITKEYLLANIHKTNDEIANEIGVNTYTITRAFRRYGIQRGKGCHNLRVNQMRPLLKAKVAGQLFLFSEIDYKL